MLVKTSKNKQNINFFPIKLILFLGFLAQFTLSVNQIVFENGYNITHEASPKKSFEIIFSNVTNYVHVIVETKSNINQILSYGTEETCTINRQLLSMNPDPKAKVELFLTKSQIQNNTHNFLCIECVNEDSCKFNLIMMLEDSCMLELGNQYIYYVFSKSNVEMIFTITNSNYKEKIGIVTIWTRGNQYLKSKLENVTVKKEKYFKNGKIYSFKESVDSGSNYIISITTKVGDLVTIGSSLSVTKSTKSTIVKHILPNSYEIMGYLQRDEKEKECYILKGRENTTYKNGSDALFINGLVFSRYASFHYDLEGKTIYKSSITDGNFKEPILASYLTNDSMSFCVTFNSDKEIYNNTELVYTFQLIDNYHLPGVPIYYPQILGTIYTRNSLAGQLTTYSSLQPLSNNNFYKITYNMKQVIGFADMLFYICNTYPKCDYSIRNNSIIKNSVNVNLFSSYTDYLTGDNPYSPISSVQPLILVNCTSASQKTTENKVITPTSGFCSFETSILSNEDYLTLKEMNPFAKFIRKGERNKYRIIFEDEVKVKKINLHLIIYTGDVNFDNITIISKDTYHSGRIIFGNEVRYSIWKGYYEYHYFGNGEINLNIIATKNSFYSISYELVRESFYSSSEINILKPGISYLKSIYTIENSKTIHKIENLKSVLSFPFLTNFYSLNCEFSVNRLTRDKDGNPTNKSVLIIDNYGQDIITNDQIGYNDEYYEYEIVIRNKDYTRHFDDFCMIYISGVEIEQTSIDIEREIFVPENIPQQIIFEKGINKIKYAFHVTDLEDPIIITFDLIDKAPYELKIYFRNIQYNSTISFDKSSQFFVKPYEWNKYCEKNEVCIISFEIVLNRTQMNDSISNPRLQTTIRQTKSGPTYLPKNELKRYILNGNYPRYFYTDIYDSRAVGEVIVNYYRGSGKIYGKIVQRNFYEVEDEANWHGIYKFPNTIEESLLYDSYFQKLIINSENTDNCINGCYLLISIEPSVEKTQHDSSVGQPFSIMTKIQKDYNNHYPKVKIEINEYVVRNFRSKFNYIDEFYELWIPYDADVIYFDWQNDHASLYVNVGDEKPKIDKAHFIFKSVGHDTIFNIKKEEILSKTNGTSIKDVHLVIGVWATDSYNSIYALKVHLAKNNQIDVYHVKSDQKVLCKPVEIEEKGKYRCLYAVIFDEINVVNSLSVLPRSQSESAHVVSYATFLEQDYFEKNDIAYLEKNTPTNSAEYKSDSAGKPYIYIERIPKKNVFYICVISDDDNILELLSGTSSLNLEVIQNPNTIQLFNTKSKLTLDFMNTKNLLINVVPVSGSGVVYLEGEKELYFNLHSLDDRLSLTFGNSTRKIIPNKLCFENDTKAENDDDPGFLFYLTYYPKTLDYNCDLLRIGKSTELNYRGTDFPINFIVPLKDLKTEIHASLNFYGFEDDKNRTRWYNEKDMLLIWGTIISEEDAYKARTSSYYKPVKENITIVNGSFDGSINVAYLTLNNTVLSDYKDVQQPYLFFSVEKNEDVKFNFSKSLAEVSIVQENGAIPAAEEEYQYGRVGFDENSSSLSNVYTLNVNKLKPYMHIQFSANSDIIDWCISSITNSNHNMSFNDNSSEYYNGKSVLIFRIPNDTKKELYLNIFAKNNTKFNENLGNYAFKYENAYSKGQITSYKVENDTFKINTNINNKNSVDYIVKVNAVPNYKYLKVSYILKGIYKNGYINGESTSTIAMTNSKGFTLQIDNPEVDEKDNSFNITLNGATPNIKYLEVIAKIKNQSIIEYVAYASESVSISGRRMSTATILMLIIVVYIILIIIVSMVIIIIKLRKKNKDLTENVKKVSFAEDEYNDNKDNTNLLTSS